MDKVEVRAGLRKGHMTGAEAEGGTAGEEGRIRIFIDDKPYFAPKPEMTGAEIKGLAQPPIPPNYDLFEEVPGPEPDPLIKNDEIVRLRADKKFYGLPPGNVG